MAYIKSPVWARPLLERMGVPCDRVQSISMKAGLHPMTEVTVTFLVDDETINPKEAA